VRDDAVHGPNAQIAVFPHKKRLSGSRDGTARAVGFRRHGVWRKNPPLEIKISWQHDHVAYRHAARPSQHEYHHIRHFAGLQEASRFFSFPQLLRGPVREQRADDGAR
jgi:hypothetical protein